MKPKTRQEIEQKSWLSVVQAYETCARSYARMLHHFDLTVPQYDLLRAVSRLRGEATPKNIAAEMLVTRGNITGLLQRLKERGLLETRQHECDGRSFVCELSGVARGVIAAADQAATVFIEQQLAPFDDDQLVDVTAMMRQMTRQLNTMTPDEIASKILDKEPIAT